MAIRSTTRALSGLIVAALTTSPAHAHIFCVPSGAYPTLQSALDAAGTGGAFNAENNTISIVRGFYSTPGTQFTYQSTDAHKLDINGGYNADCSTLIRNPALTILDGGGTTRVFSSTSTQGDVSLRFLTFQNGSVAGHGGGLQMNPSAGDNGQVIVDFNIISYNEALLSGGGFEINTGGSGGIQFDNNLVFGNVSQSYSGAGELINNGSGPTVITNNTITRNTTTLSGYLGGLYLGGSATAQYFSNNIVSVNSSHDAECVGSSVMVDNDFGLNSCTPAPGSSGNVDVDPLFVSGGNFHLAATSPLLAQGTTTPAGGLPTIDLDGNSRVYNALTNSVDMGAYEHGDEIFEDSFDR